MTTVTATDLTVVRPIGGVPYGNLTAIPFEMTVASGVFTDSDKATAVAATDKVILGTIPAGTTLLDAIIRANSDLGATGSTITIGFEYVDGVDEGAPNAQDADYFCAAQANAAAFIARASNTAVVPITLPKDAYLIATVNTAALDGDGTLRVDVIGICDQE